MKEANAKRAAPNCLRNSILSCTLEASLTDKPLLPGDSLNSGDRYGRHFTVITVIIESIKFHVHKLRRHRQLDKRCSKCFT
eukprot:m.90889 g.90889  ORF g.90889 m.90889 type:complete len:81 (-) comp13280_c1_seq4:326-568(-)